MSHPAFTPQPQRSTALRPVLIVRPTEGRRLSWPGWVVTNRSRSESCYFWHFSYYVTLGSTRKKSGVATWIAPCCTRGPPLCSLTVVVPLCRSRCPPYSSCPTGRRSPCISYAINLIAGRWDPVVYGRARRGTVSWRSSIAPCDLALVLRLARRGAPRALCPMPSIRTLKYGAFDAIPPTPTRAAALSK